MRIFKKTKDGGPHSPVDGYFLIEIKGLFSIAILKFNKGFRHNYHTHAFNALAWMISGSMVEEDISGECYKYTRSILPKYTPREKNHRVRAGHTSYCLTIRGPWADTWKEYNPITEMVTTFSHGREIISEVPDYTKRLRKREV